MEGPKRCVPPFREQGRTIALQVGGGQLTPAGGFLAEKGHRSNLHVHEGCVQAGSQQLVPLSRLSLFHPFGIPSPAELLCSPAQEMLSPPLLLPDKTPLHFQRCWAQDGPHSICTFACACVSLVMLLFTLHAKTGLALASQEQM